MTIITEGDSSFFLSSQAILVDEEFETSSSWASKLITPNKAIKWVLGKYVEADNANKNGQHWELSGLRLGLPTIQHSPMNIDHHRSEIVGTLVGAELLYPTSDNSDVINPYIEVLGAFWRAYFPETLQKIESAYNQGKLFFSQECIGTHVTCSGENSCGQSFDYKGPFHESYCEHINNRTSNRTIENPHFVGAALIVPPNKPGWGSADITDIASKTSDEVANAIISDIAQEFPHVNPSDWENMMWSIQMQKFLKIS